MNDKRLLEKKLDYFLKKLVERHYDPDLKTYDYDGIAKDVLSYVK